MTLWLALPRSGAVQDAAADGDALLIRYRSGHVYRYPGKAEMLGALMDAESAGGFVRRHLWGSESERLERRDT